MYKYIVLVYSDQIFELHIINVVNTIEGIAANTHIMNINVLRYTFMQISTENDVLGVLRK